jgi:hypothetical protein
MAVERDPNPTDLPLINRHHAPDPRPGIDYVVGGSIGSILNKAAPLSPPLIDCAAPAAPMRGSACKQKLSCAVQWMSTDRAYHNHYHSWYLPDLSTCNILFAADLIFREMSAFDNSHTAMYIDSNCLVKEHRTHSLH